ncbi:hypothetical protein CN926_00795 [Bacillus thuringiensis]|uniref:hypothetical protein n=1 Tax=Bacillus thuringiensis TaxID=1428 RepID=UPI000BFD65DA|nr:hypothetical protein [Bacillus thuringiensis]PGL88573.1 hypothetical protein CN926_00795 [Bacillus thuringiensis]PGM47388.1 hypothetical protein CN937_03710 [Bacillus thuringiensis]
MRERKPFGEYRGVTLFYNDTIITVGEPDYASLEYKCHLQNHNKSIYLYHEEIACLLNLQRLIKEETK